MFRPVHVKALSGYRIRIRYDDGVEGEVNLSNLVGKGVFCAWNDLAAFNNVSIGDHGEVRWSDTIELCPDALYLEITGKAPEEVFPNLLKAQVHA
jgi:hypothetical protein